MTTGLQTLISVKQQWARCRVPHRKPERATEASAAFKRGNGDPMLRRGPSLREHRNPRSPAPPKKGDSTSAR